MKGFLIGLIVMPALIGIFMARRPGGLLWQLRMIARRFRIMIIVVGVFLLGSSMLRLIFASGPISEYGQPILAFVLVVLFLFRAQDLPLAETTGQKELTR